VARWGDLGDRRRPRGDLSGTLDRRLLRRARAARTLLVADVAIGIAVATLVLAQATLLARVVAASFEGASLGEVATELVVLGLLFLARGALAWGFEVAGRRGAISVLSGLRSELVEARLRRHPAALDGIESAEVATVGVQGLEPLEAYFGRFLPQAVLAVVVPVAVLAWVVPIDATSAAVMLLTLPLVPVFMWLVGRYTEQRTRERARALALLATHFLDVVRGLPTLRAFNRSDAQVESIETVGERYRVATMKTLRVAFLSGAVLELAATLGVALVAVTVGVRLVDGGIGLEAGLTVLLLAPELYLPLRSLATQYHASADGIAVAERLLDLTEDGNDARSRPVEPLTDGAVARLEGVSFAYPERGGLVLENVDLELRAGETVALVGPSGGGKSTLATLLLGLHPAGTGRVLRAGRAAWVPQRPTIFAGTVADNIRLADPGADDVRVLDAAAQAGADELVASLPEGLATVVGEGGRPLSAGETQRIALARALLSDAPLVVLDEPTANLDPATAAAVGDAIERLSEERAVLLIAHRPELAARSDRIVRLEHGRLVEEAVAR
jgi:thiol reductant ABC exporter CydD subunit